MEKPSNSWLITIATLIPTIITIIAQALGYHISPETIAAFVTLFGLVSGLGVINAAHKRKTKTLPIDTTKVTKINNWLTSNLKTISGNHIFQYGDPVLKLQITDTGNHAGVTLSNSAGKIIGIAQENETGNMQITMYSKANNEYTPFPKGIYTINSLGNRRINFTIE